MSKHNFTNPTFKDGEVYGDVACRNCGQIAKKYKFSEFYKYLVNGQWVAQSPPCSRLMDEPKKLTVVEKPDTKSDAYVFKPIKKNRQQRCKGLLPFLV